MSTINYYHERRKAIYEAVQETNGRSTDEITCKWCGKSIDDAKAMDIDHVDESKGHEHVKGGWQHVYKLEKDIANDVELQVLCRKCHQKKHESPVFSPMEIE